MCMCLLAGVQDVETQTSIAPLHSKMTIRLKAIPFIVLTNI